MSGITALIGNELLSGDKTVSCDHLNGEGKVVGLYFSAHWCPPCRMFTPQLAEWYERFKSSEKGELFEIVFVSSDKDEASFQDYFSSMPWMGLPYAARDKKAQLSKQFHVQGIPMLVIVDGATGKLITSDGRSAITDDPEGAAFPWRPEPLDKLLTGEALRGSEKIELGPALAGKVRAVYFSAHWCPPCKMFTPTLCEVYNKVKEAGKDFECVFVSSDRSQEAFDEYYGTMPFLALPFNDSRVKNLKKICEVQGIPTLVIFDENNEVITTNGRGMVANDKNGDKFPWYPEPLNELTGDSASVVNDQACFIILSDASTEWEEKSKMLLTDIATENVKKQKASKATATPLTPLAFLYEGPESDDIADSLRGFASLPDRCPLVVILDIPSQKIYTLPEGDVTEKKLQQLVSDFEENKLEFKDMKK